MKFKYVDDKAVAQMFHARKRVKQRYGIRLSEEEHKEIIKIIKQGKSPGVKTLYIQSLTRSVKQVLYKGETLFLVYDNSRSSIRTFLTENMLDLEAARQYEQEKQRNRKKSNNNLVVFKKENQIDDKTSSEFVVEMKKLKQ